MNIFIHRRDLRIEDNFGLIFADQTYKNIVPIFIFDPIQIYKENNDYFSNRFVQFMCESLDNLKKSYINKNSKLTFFEGEPYYIL